MHEILWKNSIPKADASMTFTASCQLSLQAAIPEDNSEEEPLKPTDRQPINHKVKKLQDLKEKSYKLKSGIQKENAQRFNKKSGKIISRQRFNEKCFDDFDEGRGPKRKTQENVTFCKRNIRLEKEKSERK